MVVLAGGVEAAFGGALLALFRDEAGGIGLMRKRYAEHLLGRRHLEVQRQVDLGHQPVDVAIGDVAAGLAPGRGNSVRAGLGGHDRRADRIGMVAAARVPDGRDVIDVDAEAQPLGNAAARLPGLTAGIAARSSGTASASYVGTSMRISE